MARRLKIALWILAALLVGLGSAPFWAAPLIDWNSQRQRLAGLLTEALGVAVAIKGDLEVESLLPRAQMSVGRVELVLGAPDESTTVSVERVAVTVRMWPLLDGILDVTSVQIEGIRAAYTIDELGRHQWIERHTPGPHDGGDMADPEAPETRVAPDAKQPFIRDVRLGELQVSDAALVYDNRITQQTLRVSEASLRATLASLADPLELSGEFDLNERPVVLTAALNSPNSLIQGEGAHLTAAVKSALLQGANGSIVVEAPSVGQLAEWLDRPLGQMEDPGALRLSGRVSSTETQAILHALSLAPIGTSPSAAGLSSTRFPPAFLSISRAIASISTAIFPDGPRPRAACSSDLPARAGNETGSMTRSTSPCCRTFRARCASRSRLRDRADRLSRQAEGLRGRPGTRRAQPLWRPAARASESGCGRRRALTGCQAKIRSSAVRSTGPSTSRAGVERYGSCSRLSTARCSWNSTRTRTSTPRIR
jgi:hypothetical protein